MEIGSLFNVQIMDLNLKAKTKKQAISKLCHLAYKQKVVSDAEKFENDIWVREQQGTTGIGDGIAIPHNRSKYVKKATIIFAKTSSKLDWDSLDNKPVKLIFMIAMPLLSDDTHLKALATLASYLIDPKIVKELLKVKNPEAVVKIFSKQQESKDDGSLVDDSGKVLAITACPTGIAHTYMAQEKLEYFAKQLNVSIKVETQGRSGQENVLTKEDISNAKAIIIAADKNIEGVERFAGKKVLYAGTKDAITAGDKLIQKALSGEGEIVKEQSKNDDSFLTDIVQSWKSFRSVYKHIMAGVSRMLPFIVAGGIILGIGFLLDSGIDGNNNFGTVRLQSGWFSALGKLSLSMIVPVLGGFIAYSLVGWQGLLPGFIAGLIADAPGLLYTVDINEGWSNLWGRLIPEIKIGDITLQFNSGFIGAIIGGYLAGVIVFALTQWTRKVPATFRGVKDIVFVPLLSVLFIGLIMFALNIPLGFLNLGLKTGIKKMYDYNLHILVGIIVAAMMAVDMGGPINKAAYVLGTSLIADGESGQKVMASVMAGGMVPPLIIALTTLIFKSQYTIEERNAGISNWFMGLSFITEGAIPFAATRPKKVIPSIVIGSAITGALVMLFNISLPAPHGGIFVFPLLRNHWVTDSGMQIGLGIILYVAALVVGMVIGALLLGLLNSKYFMEKISNKKVKK